MSQLQQFQFGLMDLRVIELEGQPWFVLKDIARVLGLHAHPTGGYAHHTRALGRDERQVVEKTHMPELWVIYGSGVRQTLVSESGLYKLVMRSDKPEAKAFQDWVTRVVLPAIRKDGSYVLGEEKVVTGEMSEEELILKALQAQQRKIERITQERDQAAKEAARLAAHNAFLANEKRHLEDYNQRILPAAQVGDAVGQRKGMSVVDFARKLEGVNVNQVRNDLGAMQYLFRRQGNWSVYAKFRDTLFSEKAAPDGRSVIVALEKGQQLLVQLYHEGRLTMKAGCKPKRRLELVA